MALLLSLVLIGAALAADQVAPEGSVAGYENSSAQGSQASAPANLQGIWKISLAGAEITMALNQSGDKISGQCKFEGNDPWNGVVAGTVSGRAVWVAMAALKGQVFAATEMVATADQDSLDGSFTQRDSSGAEGSGEFTAARTSMDAEDYAPAETKPAPTTAAPELKPEQAPAQASAASSGSGLTQYRDVTELAKGIDPVIMPRHVSLS